jgi:hypothetical protein
LAPLSGLACCRLPIAGKDSGIKRPAEAGSFQLTDERFAAEAMATLGEWKVGGKAAGIIISTSAAPTIVSFDQL